MILQLICPNCHTLGYHDNEEMDEDENAICDDCGHGFAVSEQTPYTRFDI